MQNNFYFLRQISAALRVRIGGAVVSECFSQAKDELVIRMEVGSSPFFIRASLSPSLSCLSFPKKFERARKNSVDLFSCIIGRQIAGVRQFENERSFALLLSDGHALLFKMHGSRTNIVLFEGDKATDVFRKNMSADLNIDFHSLDRTIDWSAANFSSHLSDIKKVYFTFGKIVWRYLEEQGFSQLGENEGWRLIRSTLDQLMNPKYYITMVDSKPVLSLVGTGVVEKVLTEPVDAANEFFHRYTHQYTFEKEKNGLLAILNAKLAAGRSYIAKNSEKLDEVRADDHYKIWADLIMANLHLIKGGMDEVVVENFYDNQRPVTIRLKKDLTPQRNAEIYYRKARNQHIEIERLQSSIGARRAELEEIERLKKRVEETGELKSLRAIAGVKNLTVERREEGPRPYHEFTFRGFRIWVGKNANSNDELTFRWGYKEDLWLHAKDVSGSHVLIKHQSGKNFPKDVIEYAASLAAFNSKRKTDTLCPVIVTPRKWVRKRKGDPPGAVVVERENVIMVEPMKP